jgi:hypothetical protein
MREAVREVRTLLRLPCAVAHSVLRSADNRRRVAALLSEGVRQWQSEGAGDDESLSLQEQVSE